MGYTVPARGPLPPVTIHWVNGPAPGWKEKLAELIGSPADWPEPKGKEKDGKWSDFAEAVLIGTKGRLHSTGHNYTIDLLPARQFEGVDTSGPKRLTQSHGMPEPDWLWVARGDTKWIAWSDFSSTGPCMDMLLLANVATQFDDELEYGPLGGQGRQQRRSVRPPPPSLPRRLVALTLAHPKVSAPSGGGINRMKGAAADAGPISFCAPSPNGSPHPIEMAGIAESASHARGCTPQQLPGTVFPKRLHSAIGYVAPLDKLEGCAEAIWGERDRHASGEEVRWLKCSEAASQVAAQHAPGPPRRQEA